MARPPSSQPTQWHFDERIRVLTELHRELANDKMNIAYELKVSGNKRRRTLFPFSPAVRAFLLV